MRLCQSLWMSFFVCEEVGELEKTLGEKKFNGNLGDPKTNDWHKGLGREAQEKIGVVGN